MTKLRLPGTRHEALDQALALLGMEAACKATGRSVGHLKHCSDPDEGREIAFAHVEDLCRALAAAGLDVPLLRHLEQVVRDARPAGEAAPTPPDPHAVLLGCMQSLGDLSGTFRRAMEDGLISLRERIGLRAKVADLRREVDDLWQALAEDPQDKRITQLEREASAQAAIAREVCADNVRLEARLKRARQARSGR